MNDGLLEVVLIKNPSNPAEMVELLTDIQSFNLNGKMLEFFSDSSLEIETEEKMDWTLDGEFEKGRNKIIVNNIKSAFTIIINKENKQLRLTENTNK